MPLEKVHQLIRAHPILAATQRQN